MPFCGKVLIDDVYSSGSRKDGPYPLLSRAMELGLYHPRCRDIHTTYFPGISTMGDGWTQEEMDAVNNNAKQEAKQEAKQQYAKRQQEKYERLSKYSLDEENQKKYSLKSKLWKSVQKKIDDVREHEPVLLSQLETSHKNAIVNLLSRSDNRIQDITLKYLNDIVFINEKAVGTAVSKKKGIRVNLVKDTKNPRGEYTSTFHEIGHSIDRAGGGLSHKTSDFKNALFKEFNNIVNAFQKEYNINQTEAYKIIGKSLDNDKYYSVSDIVSGITKNKCRGKYGHESAYWEKEHKLEAEAFAHFYEAFARNDIVKTTVLSEMFPTAKEEFMKLME